MDIPSKVRVTSKVTYLVFQSDAIDPDLGQCNPNTKQIILNTKQSPKEIRLTYIHELLHALSFEYEINITESQVQKLENAIYKLLLLNKLI